MLSLSVIRRCHLREGMPIREIARRTVCQAKRQMRGDLSQPSSSHPLSGSGRFAPEHVCSKKFHCHLIRDGFDYRIPADRIRLSIGRGLGGKSLVVDTWGTVFLLGEARRRRGFSHREKHLGVASYDVSLMTLPGARASSSHKSVHPSQCFLDVGQGGRVTTTHKTLAGWPKCGAWDNSNLFLDK